MDRQPDLRPPLDSELLSASPHLSDYIQVVTRRLWLVLLIFAVTTASAIWAVSRQKTLWRSEMAVQVTDPLERARSLTSPTRVSGMDIFVDPMQSQIEVLQSRSIAERVADELGLRLRRRGTNTVRSELFSDAVVTDEAEPGWYELRYSADGASAALVHAPTGDTVGTADAGEVLEAPGLRFVLKRAPEEFRTYLLEVVPSVAQVASEVRLVGTAREQTNIIDIYLTHEDPELAPKMLGAAARALSEFGARQVRERAESDLEFAEAQLDSARNNLQRSFQKIREFKETEAFTNLTAEEQQLVQRRQDALERLQQLDDQRQALQNLMVDIQAAGVEGVDIVAFLAALPQGVNPQITAIAEDIRDKQDEIQRLLTEERVTPDHPRVQAIRTQLARDEGSLRDAVDRHLQGIDREMAEVRTELDRIQEAQRRFPQLQNRYDELDLQRSIDREMVLYLQSQLYQAQILAQGAGDGFIDVVDPPGAPIEVTPRGKINLMLGALLGLILGVGAAFFLEYLDRTVRTSADVETLLGIPVLGIIPRLRKVDEEDDRRAGLPLIVALDPLDPAAEAYRNLRMNLMFMSTEDEPIRTILFSSPGPHEGKSTTAVNFAVMLAQQGQRVLLIDADLRRPSLHRAMDLLREPGLTNLLVGDAEAREAIRPNVLPNLDMLPSGPFPPNPSELLNSKAMQRLLEELQGKYSHIIVDSPPVLAVTDAALLGAHTDGVVLVLRSGETEQRAAERAVEQLRRVGVRVFGAVLNEVSTSNAEESYYLQYYYGYHPREETGWQRLRSGLSRARFW
ncbi:MAG: polysaccharide biosynthesis tyrosine autokinase [Gemmatimonadetes bacterium]|nr:MAG: polysaccharide biosynthesis tyrosine autokinase [Gemmatimonadota bacterium]